MAVLSPDKTYVTVEYGDTLWDIAQTYLGDPYKYQQLAAIKRNNISNPDLIFVGQKVYLSEGSSPSPAPSKSSGSKVVTINQFGLSSASENTLFATWTWGKDSQTDSYKIAWAYTTIDGVEFTDLSSNAVDEHHYAASRTSTYSIPANATKVTFRVKPISKTYTSNDKETTYWTADWSSLKTHMISTPLEAPSSTPNLEVDGLKLTAEIENIDTVATDVQFRLVKNNTTIVETTKAVAINKDTRYVSYAWPAVDPGSEYVVCYRTVKGSLYSDWSDYSSSVSTIPSAPEGITECRAIDESTVYLAWSAAGSATGYTIEYTDQKEYFDSSSEVTSVSVEEGTGYYITNMDTGKEYFFRVRANNDAGDSDWTAIVSIVIGKAPSSPTTWSSTTTAIVGEIVNLYWVHNAEDGSSQTYAELELTIGDDEPYSIDISNSEEEDEKDKTSVYSIDTSEYSEGVSIRWRVRTAGVTLQYGDWSVQRTIDIYAQPTLQLKVTDVDGNYLQEIAAFPFYVDALPGPVTQHPIGYHLSVVSNEMYESVDAIGNPIIINAGQEVYSRYFDTNFDLKVVMSAGNIDLERNITYTITCVVTMDSGLTAETSQEFMVTWSEVLYTPNASISIDEDSYTAYIRPYCDDRVLVSHLVAIDNGVYTKTDTVIGSSWGNPFENAYTTTGERVYFGMDGEGNEIYFCEVEEVTVVENVLLSVYRREFDGSFTEIATGLDNSRNVTVTDPHPALDYARYRIVATSIDTGAVGYYDMPGYPVGGVAIIIQWNEEWTSFEANSEDRLSRPPWSGSLLKLPYNVDVQDSNTSDVSLIEYIGRSHPVTYYGTQLGNTSTWNVEIPKSDKETLYGLRRLAIWLGDVYVREPSGSGYWANIKVSFSQKHCDVTIPVTFDITRVEGGI